MGIKKSKSQKVYRMKGCSKKTKKYLGGSKHLSNVPLAYPTNKIFSVPNPHIAYIGKGGSSCTDLAYTGKPGPDSVYPNPGAQGQFPGWLNPSMQRGGSCGCGQVQSGGTCSSCNGGLNINNSMVGGRIGGKHRKGCKCSKCCNKGLKGGNNGLPYGENLPFMKGTLYPNGLTGQSWQANYQWPGTTNISGNNNHYELNKYVPDISRQMIATGAQPPFSVGGGKRKKSLKNRKQRGGASNGLFQDFTNLGRQFTYGLGSAYNGLRGYSAPTNPMPWKGQLPNVPSLSTIKAAYI
jgi:hypothetical protein